MIYSLAGKRGSAIAAIHATGTLLQAPANFLQAPENEQSQIPSSSTATGASSVLEPAVPLNEEGINAVLHIEKYF